MSSPEPTVNGAPLADDAARVLAEAERLLADGRVADVPDEAVQQLLLAAVRLFSAKRDLGGRQEAFPQHAVTATDVAVTAVAMAEAVQIELFELALWRGWSNI
jgi:hypothetical protein